MNKVDLKKIIIIFLLSRLLLILFIIIKKDISILTLYDGVHYINIAKNGYSEPLLYAFFPLYPLLIRLLSIVIHSYEISGFIISNICSFMSLVLLNKIVKEKNIFNLICFAFSPILAFTTIIYTESLFMFLTLLGYYLYKKDKYILSAIIVGLSILTRNSGIILWGSIGIDMLYRLFKKKDIKFKNILLFGIISLLIGMIYPIYLYITEGNFLMFAKVQNTYWGRVNGTIIDGISKDITVLKRDYNPFNIIIFLENWLSFIIALILGIKITKKNITCGIYVVVSLLAFTISFRDINYWISLASISLFRYVLNLFPIYLYIFDKKNNNQKWIIAIIFLSICIYNTTLFYLGAFIA